MLWLFVPNDLPQIAHVYHLAADWTGIEIVLFEGKVAPDGHDWIHEIKFYGYRTQIIKDADGIRASAYSPRTATTGRPDTDTLPRKRPRSTLKTQAWPCGPREVSERRGAAASRLASGLLGKMS